MSTLRHSQWPKLSTNLQSPVEIRPPDLVQPDFLRHTLGPSGAKSLNSFIAYAPVLKFHAKQFRISPDGYGLMTIPITGFSLSK